MKIALLQIDPTVGDIEGNAARIAAAVVEARAAGADLAVTPELALVGYLPRDLLLSEAEYKELRPFETDEYRSLQTTSFENLKWMAEKTTP